MWLVDGKYDSQLHHNSHRAVGVPGTVAGLHLAWKTLGSKPWKDLVAPAVKLARDGFELSDGAGAIARAHARPASRSTRRRWRSSRRTARPIRPARLFKQPDLARTLERIADQGPAGFYEGETAALLEKEMKANGGLITREDLKNYQAKQRAPIKGTYRGYEIIGMAPPSSGGIAVQMMLNILEALRPQGQRLRLGAEHCTCIAESMRRAFADRAQYLGDPDFVKTMPIDRLLSKDYAARAAQDDQPDAGVEVVADDLHLDARVARRPRTSRSSTRSATPSSMTYTLEAGYGSKIVVPGAGFLLNNEMGDFNAGPGPDQRAGPHRHRAEPRAAGQAHAVEHVADDRRQGRQAVHGDRHARRPHDHQHRADDDPQRRSTSA